MTTVYYAEPPILIWAFLIGVYLIAIYRLFYKLKKAHPDFWAHIGSPSIFDPVDQIALMKIVIFGVGLPHDLKSLYRINLLIVRWLLAFHALVFLLFFVAAVVS